MTPFLQLQARGLYRTLTARLISKIQPFVLIEPSPSDRFIKVSKDKNRKFQNLFLAFHSLKQLQKPMSNLAFGQVYDHR